MISTTYKPSDFYKPKLRWRGPVTVLLFIVAAALVAAVVIFYAMGRYAVVDRENLSIVVPYLEASSAEDAPEDNSAKTLTAPAEIIVDEPDFDTVVTSAGEGLEPVKAIYISADGMNDSVLSSALGKMNEKGANAILLQLKGSDGQLMWSSQVDDAVSFGVSGTLELSSYIENWKSSGVYLVAQISCCADGLMAMRNPSLALKNSDGSPYTDESGRYWLDPYSRSVREYIAALAKELLSMGFDEVLFADLCHPRAEGLTYSQSMTAAPDPEAAIDSFALHLSRRLGDGEGKISVLCDVESARYGQSAQTGEDLDFFFRVFDRVYCPTDSYDIEYDKNTVTSHMSSGDISTRFVPVASYTPSLESWVITE